MFEQDQILPDINDVHELLELEKQITEITNNLNKSIEKEAELEIKILEYMKFFPEIKHSLSPKNKFITLRQICENKDIEIVIDSWITQKSCLKIFRNTLEQLKGMRDSIKKKFTVLP